MAKATPTPNLPPAGYERDEELKQREDALQEQAELAAEQVDVGRANPKVFHVDNELAQWFDELDVNGAQDEYAYSWTPTHTYGRFVQQKLYKGWEIVQGDMPEARALKHTDTTRKLGDVILMRIKKDRKAMLDKREDYKRAQQELGVSAQLQELADRYGTRIIDQEEMDPGQLRRLEAQARARGRAGKMMDKWLRDGRMPGMTR